MEYRKIVTVGTVREDGVELLDENKQLIGTLKCWPPELAFALCMHIGRDEDLKDTLAMFCSAEDRRRLGT